MATDLQVGLGQGHVFLRFDPHRVLRIGEVMHVQPRPVDRLLQVSAADGECRQHLCQRGRDAVGPGAADGQDVSAAGASDPGRHVRGEPLPRLRTAPPPRFATAMAASALAGLGAATPIRNLMPSSCPLPSHGLVGRQVTQRWLRPVYSVVHRLVPRSCLSTMSSGSVVLVGVVGGGPYVAGMDHSDGPGGDEPREPGGAADVDLDIEALRASARRIALPQASQLRLVARVARRCTQEARAQLAATSGEWSTHSEDELIASLVTTELMVALGIAEGPARQLERLATRLVHVLPDTLTAVEAGQLDLARATVLSEATELLEDGAARAVEALVLPGTGDAPWEGPAPRNWQARIRRAVVKVDADAARRKRELALKLRAVRAWWQGDGTGVLQVVGADLDIAMADRVIADLANAWPAVTPDGTPLGMDQRRVDSVMDLFRRVGSGEELPRVAVRREREVGIVLHADTLFVDGPAAADPGELRGLGAPVPVDPTTARETARAEIAGGAGTRVLLVDGVGDDAGVLRRAIRLPKAPPEGWTRPTLTAAVRAALEAGLPALQTESYVPTVAIAEHVRVVHPRCTAYDCARVSRRSDLDHDQPWPRGPTCVSNLCPRCRRHHELKTRGLLHTCLHRDGSLTTTTFFGMRVTTRPEPLPGHGLDEAYGPTVRVPMPDHVQV